MGTEKDLTSTIVDLIHGEGNPEKPGGLNLQGGTPNHKALAAACSYGWTRAFGNGEQKDKARGKVLDLFAEQKKGHYNWGDANEVLTASHYNWWGTALAALRWFARKQGDEQIVDLSSRWWRGEIALLSLVSVPSGKLQGNIVSPGARTRYSPSNPSSGGDTTRDVMYSLVMGLNANRKKEPWFKKAAGKEALDTVAAWIVRELLADGDDLGGAKQAGLRALDGNTNDLPPLRDRLQVARTPEGHVAWFETMTGASKGKQKPQFSAWCHYGNGEQEYGLEATTTPREPPGGFTGSKRTSVEPV
ncbi:MAG: hypothetical protein ABUT39_02400 [Acidobacteriota bacterium]